MLEPQGDIAILRINRPEALNAMNVDVISELSKMLDILAADDSIKAVVITGAGERSFCAGADISYMVNIDPMQAERYFRSRRNKQNRPAGKTSNCCSKRLCTWRRCELQWPAISGSPKQCQDGAARSDNRHTSRMGWNTTPGASCRSGRQRRLIFTGKMITADRAYPIGLVNKVISLGSDDKLPRSTQR